MSLFLYLYWTFFPLISLSLSPSLPSSLFNMAESDESEDIPEFV